MIMNLMDCTGCGFAFRTERGATGNFYLAGTTDWWMNHECTYCGAVTHIGHGLVTPFPPVRRRRKSMSVS